MRNRHAFWKFAGIKKFGFVRHKRDAINALGAHCMCDRVYRNRSIDRLTAGHRYGVVVEDLVSDIGFRGNCLPNCQRAGMIESAITQVLENVLAAIEFRACYPVNTFASHLNQAVSIAIHPAGHEVTADAGERL